MNFSHTNWRVALLCCALCLGFFMGNTRASTPEAPQIKADEKSKVSGTIVSRSGDLVKVNDKKTGQVAVVVISDTTKIERKNGKAEFFRHKDMDVTAMVPGLTIEAEGVGNAKGQLAANKITFVPDIFAVEVAEEQQIQANKTAAGKAQTTANQGVAAAGQAQSSANQAQSSANQAGQAAAAAGDVAVLDAAAIQTVNKRVSDMDDYKTVAEAGLYFASDKATLDDAAKADLDIVVAATKGVDGYLIEIAGYASSTGTKQLNQQLSEERAAAVANYLIQKGNIPMRRIVAPAGYGATHPAAENSDAQGRALNRRVDVKVLLNKGMVEGT
jgi:outer membrane protein OmpA-like peptidoglycan-associated protein